jgi:hypothetical protein
MLFIKIGFGCPDHFLVLIVSLYKKKKTNSNYKKVMFYDNFFLDRSRSIVLLTIDNNGQPISDKCIIDTIIG